MIPNHEQQLHQCKPKLACKQVGFTLVELIVVITVLAILAATGLPRFIKMSTEANLASIQAMGGAILSSANLVYAKSTILGIQNQALNNIDLGNNGTTDVQIVYGYPSASRVNGISNIMGGDFSETWTWSSNASDTVFWLTTATLGKRKGLYINNTAVMASNCYLLYFQASATAGPRVSYITSGC